MRSGPLELQPAREFAQRMHELETELQRARRAQRRLKADPDAPSRWGLETRVPAQQEEGWFLTYLDVMTLLLVAMIVMLAFSGGMMRHGGEAAAKLALHPPLAAHPAPDAGALPTSAPATPPGAEDRPDDILTPEAAFPYPAAPADAFEQSAYPSQAVAALASAYPTPMDLAPRQPVEAAPAPAAAAAPPQSDTGATAPVPLSSTSPGIAPTATAMSAAAPGPAPSPQAAAHPAPDTASAALPAPAPSASPAEPPPAQAADKPVNAQSEGQSLAAALPLDELGSEVEVIVNKRSVSLRINSEILFGTGQADLSPHGLAVLKRMAEVLTKGGYDIMVEGHTDSVPVRNNGRYPSNWELSSARAGSVVRYFQANGIDKAHLKAVGYADTRPIASNRDAEGRARNRRVELVIEKPEPVATGGLGKPAPTAADTPPPAASKP